jgi:alkylhydroperoxidase family enzyme
MTNIDMGRSRCFLLARSGIVTLGLVAAAAGLAVNAEEVSNQPKPIPVTRGEVKEALDRLKYRTPRLPLPEPTAEERQARDGRGFVNNGRMRALYLPEELRSGGFSRARDPRMTFDYAFSTELFWIVSRVNNCHYCLGHQENKLLSAGLLEDDIAALDGDWKQFSPQRQAAFAFTRQLTFAPHEVSDEHLDALLKHYTPVEALEIVFLVSRYNATNRWTDALGIPQEEHRTFLTATSKQFETCPTEVAPRKVAERPSLPGLSEWQAELAARKTRTPRLPLVDDEEVREWLELRDDAPVPPHVRLLANFPITGKTWVAYLAAAEDKGELAPLLRAQIAWTAARHDRAWYAQGVARQRLQQLGMTDEAIFGAEDEQGSDSAISSVIRLTRRLTETPQQMTDADIAAVREHFSPQVTAEIVHHITLAAFFNRLTEAAGLPWSE